MHLFSADKHRAFTFWVYAPRMAREFTPAAEYALLKVDCGSFLPRHLNVQLCQLLFRNTLGLPILEEDDEVAGRSKLEG